MDKEIQNLILEEKIRQQNTLQLIASENITSKEVREACGSILTNRYAEGKPYKRYYNGCDIIDQIESLAQERACKLFGMDHANVQPHSGAQANMAVFLACLNNGDTILSMDLSNGGHLSHGSPVNFSGKFYNVISYGINDNGFIDYEDVELKASKYQPKLIICGASNYSKIIDFKKFREIADKVGALLLADIAHIAGLVAGGVHPSPAPYADFVTTTTHKSLRGPRGGIIMCKNEWADKIDKAVFPGVQGGPLEHIIAAKAICLYEASQRKFSDYAKNIVSNAQALCSGLIKRGIKVVGGMTQNHLMTIDLTPLDITGKQGADLLEQVGIICNKNTIPNDPRGPFITSGLRIGTCSITTRGLDTKDMDSLAQLIASTLTGGNMLLIRQEVQALCDKYPIGE